MLTLRQSPAYAAYQWWRARAGRGGSQSDEGAILRRLAIEVDAPRTFIEFGFHPTQFNCFALRNDFHGLLVDGDQRSVDVAQMVLPKTVSAERKFLTLDNIGELRGRFPQLGILSIDVDGNDYWFLEALIGEAPAILALEYNSTFGLEPITTAYDPAFERHAKHSSGWYHGASLMALAKLCAAHGYGLAAISDSGVNAFFTKTGNLDPAEAWKSSSLREKWSGKTVAQQWDAIAHLDYVRV